MFLITVKLETGKLTCGIGSLNRLMFGEYWQEESMRETSWKALKCQACAVQYGGQ